MMEYSTYYASIAKPFFAPEPWVFGVAWGIIYPLIAIAFVLVLYGIRQRKISTALLWVFVVNMIANFAFTPIQLGVQSTLLATLDIFIVLSTLAYLQWRLFREKQYLIVLLLLPYLLWGVFATVLQTTILLIN